MIEATCAELRVGTRGKPGTWVRAGVVTLIALSKYSVRVFPFPLTAPAGGSGRA